MKTAELQAGKEYFVYNRDHWISATYTQTYLKTANNLQRYRYTPALDEQGNFRKHNGKILMRTKSGSVDWIVLRHIREEFFTAVSLITKTNQARYDDNVIRGKKYANHLARKAERERNEREKPVKEQFFKLIKATSKHYISGYDRVEQLPIETMQAIAEALLKTGVKA